MRSNLSRSRTSAQSWPVNRGPQKHTCLSIFAKFCPPQEDLLIETGAASHTPIAAVGIDSPVLMTGSSEQTQPPAVASPERSPDGVSGDSPGRQGHATNHGTVRPSSACSDANNPGQHSGIIDSSGLEILLTPKLRQYDSGLMTVGHDVSSLHLIPPGLEHYTSVGHCPDLCTSVITNTK